MNHMADCGSASLLRRILLCSDWNFNNQRIRRLKRTVPFTFSRDWRGAWRASPLWSLQGLEGGFKEAWEGLQGLQGGFKAAWEGLQGAWRGLEKGFNEASRWRELQGAWRRLQKGFRGLRRVEEGFKAAWWGRQKCFRGGHDLNSKFFI